MTSRIQSGLQLAAIALNLAMSAEWGGDFDGRVKALKLDSGQYHIDQSQMPEGKGVFVTIPVKDSVKHRLVSPGEYATLRKRPGEPWQVEARDE